MFTNRLSKASVVIILVVVGLLAIPVIAQASIASNTNHPYVQSKQQALREYTLGERYGVVPQAAVQISPAQALREYQLGERYGVLPQGALRFSPAKTLREYQLGERYGETPQDYAKQKALREYILGERYGVMP